MATTRAAILGALLARLEAIATTAGYETNAGAHVYLGEVLALGPDDPDVVIGILPQDDAVQWQGVGLFVQWPIEIQAVAKVDVEDGWLTVEAVLGDIKRAVEQEDRMLGGLVKRQLIRDRTITLEREPGSTTMGVGIIYVAPYGEAWGQP